MSSHILLGSRGLLSAHQACMVHAFNYLQSHLAGPWSFFSVVERLADALGYDRYLLKHVLKFFQAWVSSSRLQELCRTLRIL